MSVFLGLGSNLGDREAHLAGAVRSLLALDSGLVVSPLYETAPVGGPEHQGRYLNCVVRLETAVAPRELLELAKRLEREAGRVATVRNGPRTLDVDVLIVDGAEVHEPDLEVPHPRLAERAFVLAPLGDLDASRTPADWRARLEGGDPASLDVRRVGTLSYS